MKWVGAKKRHGRITFNKVVSKNIIVDNIKMKSKYG
jgi:hypothetical protein